MSTVFRHPQLTAPPPPPPLASSQPERSDLGVPAWVAALLARNGLADADPTGAESADAGGELSVLASPGVTLLTVRKAGAASLDPAAFEACTRDAYAAIASRLRRAAARHPVRFWNYIPDIHRPSGAGLDRYMCFNAGRFAACSAWLGGPGAFDRLLATGSGVGHAGPDLVIHALAAAAPGVAVENPRQVPAYRYSRRFGPRPPCFARATVLREPGRPPLVLVGGTASIRGEESVHVGDLRRQTLETFENLAALVRSAAGGGHGRGDDVSAGQPVAGDVGSGDVGTGDTGLGAFRDLRVYHGRDSDRATIAELVRRAFPHLDHVEYLRADLCRPELAVEIEGVAELTPDPDPCP